MYVDGFNLYYGALKGTQYKWLDLVRLAQALLPRHRIEHLHYFTAKVRSHADDPEVDQRQRAYLRALATIPNLTIHYGHFLSSVVRMPLVQRAVGARREWVEVTKMEEKGSDVNLATQLLVDGFNGRFAAAAVISNDSDLSRPVRVVREDLALPVGVLNPYPKRNWELSPSLLPAGSFYKPIRQQAIASSQFPLSLADEHGTVTCPARWLQKSKGRP